MPTLVEKAKKLVVRPGSKPKYPITRAEIEVAFAWLRGEVTISQAASVMPGKPQGGNVYARLALCLKEAYANGSLKLKK